MAHLCPLCKHPLSVREDGQVGCITPNCYGIIYNVLDREEEYENCIVELRKDIEILCDTISNAYDDGYSDCKLRKVKQIRCYPIRDKYRIKRAERNLNRRGL